MGTEQGGVYESYSGVFIWTAPGDVRSESMLRRGSSTVITNQIIVVRAQDQKAETYRRINDATVGHVEITKAKDVSRVWAGSFANIFLLEKIKRDVDDPGLDPAVSSGTVDGRPVSVLTFGVTGVPGSLLCRYWIDLSRGGLVVRQEDYVPGGQMAGRLDIKLAAFQGRHQ